MGWYRCGLFCRSKQSAPSDGFRHGVCAGTYETRTLTQSSAATILPISALLDDPDGQDVDHWMDDLGVHGDDSRTPGEEVTKCGLRDVRPRQGGASKARKGQSPRCPRRCVRTSSNMAVWTKRQESDGQPITDLLPTISSRKMRTLISPSSQRGIMGYSRKPRRGLPYTSVIEAFTNSPTGVL